MAVARPVKSNLAPFFENIQRGIERGGEIAVKREEAKLQNVLERRSRAVLNKVLDAKVDQAISNFGKDKFTQKDADALIKETKSTGRTAFKINKMIGIRISPKERSDFDVEVNDAATIELRRQGLLDLKKLSPEDRAQAELLKPEEFPAFFKQLDEAKRLKEQQAAGRSGDIEELGAAFPGKRAEAEFREPKTPQPTLGEKAGANISEAIIGSALKDPTSVTSEQFKSAAEALGFSVTKIEVDQPGRIAKFFGAKEANKFIIELGKKPGDRFTDEELIRIKSKITGGEDRNLTKAEKDQFLKVAKELGIDISLNK